MPSTLGYTHCICADIMAPSSIRTYNSELLRVICLLLCGFSLSFFSCSCSKLIFYILHFFSYLAFLPSISFSFSSPPTYVTNVKHLAPYFSMLISCTHGEEDRFTKMVYYMQELHLAFLAFQCVISFQVR